METLSIPLYNLSLIAKIHTIVGYDNQSPVESITSSIKVNKDSLFTRGSDLLNTLQRDHNRACFWQVKIVWDLPDDETGEMVLTAHQSITSPVMTQSAFMC